MNRRPSITRLLTHSLALGCGILLASALADRSLFTLSPPAKAASLPPKTPARAALDTPSSSGAATAPGMSKSAIYQEAWTSLRAQPHNRQERTDRQLELLRQWAELDPEAAMQASLADGYIPLSWETGRSRYADAFAEIFRDRPVETLKILTSGRLTGDLSDLVGSWITSAAEKDPQLLLSLAGEFSPAERSTILSRLTEEGRPPSMPQVMEALITGLEPAEALDFIRTSWDGEAGPYDPLAAQDRSTQTESLLQQWLALPDGPGRTIALAQWALSAGNCRGEDFEAGWQQIPAADRALAARAMITLMPSNTATQPAVLDHAIEFGLWREILTYGVPALENARGPTPTIHRGEDDPGDPFASTPNPAPPPAGHPLLDWALKLPDRPEARMLLQTIVSRDDDAMELLMALPPGDWRRELGLTQRILQHSDSSEAATAYAALTDPRRRAAVDDYRRDRNLPPIPPPATPDQ
ncbi:MAG: hypothetical protein JWO82_487 [Akkermansiaceae bacterium]|nr:hypothetical protein [Akkermansiaceae bacterium]